MKLLCIDNMKQGIRKSYPIPGLTEGKIYIGNVASHNGSLLAIIYNDNGAWDMLEAWRFKPK